MTTDDSYIDGGWGLAALQGRIRVALRRVHRCDKGATLTEFIIVLPVFITVFIAVMELAKLQTARVQIQTAATGDLWEQAIPVQRNLSPPAPSNRYTDPGRADDDSGDVVDDSDDVNRAFSDPVDDQMAQAMEDGTIGEAGAALNAGGAANRTGADDLPYLTGVEPDTDDVLVRGQASPNTPMYADQIVDDRGGHTSRTPPTGPPPVLGAGVPTAKGGDETNASFAAGIRYGLVGATRNAPPGFFDGITGAGDVAIDETEVEVGYSTLVAPYPMVFDSGTNQHFTPVGTARRYMVNHPAYGNLYGIDFGNQ